MHLINIMKSRFVKQALCAITTVTLTVSVAVAADLKFKPGADKKFNWASYEKLKKMKLKGETITIFAPWLGPDKALFESVLAFL